MVLQKLWRLFFFFFFPVLVVLEGVGGEKGKGVGEQRSVWAVIGCRLSFSLSHKHTQQQCPPTTLEGTGGEGKKSERGILFGTFPSAPYVRLSAISFPPPHPAPPSPRFFSIALHKCVCAEDGDDDV